MSGLELPPITGKHMTSTGTFEDGVIRIKLAGTADAEVRVELDRVVKKLHEEALRLGASKVRVDFRELEFMNSSCFKVFVTWLAQVRELDPARQYRIHIVSNPDQHWQRRSLAALSCFAVDLVAIET